MKLVTSNSIISVLVKAEDKAEKGTMKGALLYVRAQLDAFMVQMPDDALAISCIIDRLGDAYESRRKATFIAQLQGERWGLLDVPAELDALQLFSLYHTEKTLLETVELWNALHAEALEMDARHACTVPDAVALVDYLTAAIADGAGSLGGYVLRKGDEFHCVGDRGFTKNPLKASYFSDKEKHLMPQFISLYGMTAMRLGDAVRAALSAAKAACEKPTNSNYKKLTAETLHNYHMIFGDNYLLDADKQHCSPAVDSVVTFTELHHGNRRYAVASYGRKYQHGVRTDRYHTLSLTR